MAGTVPAASFAADAAAVSGAFSRVEEALKENTGGEEPEAEKEAGGESDSGTPESAESEEAKGSEKPSEYAPEASKSKENEESESKSDGEEEITAESGAESTDEEKPDEGGHESVPQEEEQTESSNEEKSWPSEQKTETENSSGSEESKPENEAEKLSSAEEKKRGTEADAPVEEQDDSGTRKAAKKKAVKKAMDASKDCDIDPDEFVKIDLDKEAQSKYEYENVDTVILPEVSKEGFTFLYWTKDPDDYKADTHEAGSTYEIQSDDDKLYAVFEDDDGNIFIEGTDSGTDTVEADSEDDVEDEESDDDETIATPSEIPAPAADAAGQKSEDDIKKEKAEETAPDDEKPAVSAEIPKASDVEELEEIFTKPKFDIVKSVISIRQTDGGVVTHKRNLACSDDFGKAPDSKDLSKAPRADAPDVDDDSGGGADNRDSS